MGFWRGIAEAFGASVTPARMAAPAPNARFAIDIPPEMLEAMTSGGTIAPRISRAQALQVPAVLRARNLICGSLGTLPIRVHDQSRKVVTGAPYVVPEPDPEIASSVVMAMTVEDLFFEGLAWWKVTRFGPQGFPLEARHVPTQSVTVQPTRALLPSTQQITPDEPFPADGAVYIDGIRVLDREIIRFDSPNPPFLIHAARAIRTCLLLDTAAALYSKDPLPLGYFAPRDPNADPASDDEIQHVLDDWEAARAKRAWGYVNAALEAKTLSWNPEQLQLADQRQHAVLEIARAAGVDPEDLGVSTTSRTYANSEQRRQDLIDFTLGAYVSAIQDRLSMRDVLPRGFVARIDFAGFLRGDTKTRMETYKVGLEVGAYTVDEIRELEDRPALTPAQKAARAPAPVSIPGKAPAMASSEPVNIHFDVREELERERAARAALEAEVAALRETVEKLSALAEQATSRPERADFDAAETVQFQFDVDTADFQVDTARRTIVGMLLPWGKVANNGFAKWRFTEGSVSWSEVNRVKLNRFHDSHDLIGVASRLQSGSRGLTGTFKVGRGPEGDRALQQAEDGILDGFSVEINFESSDSWQPDPTDESVRLVRDGTLRGVALTGTPAFDDARLTSVTAERTTTPVRGNTMGENARTATVAAAAAGTTSDADGYQTFMTTLADKIAESQKTATEGLTEMISESLSAGIKAALENLHDPQTDGPQPVRAARWTVTREAPVYSLDGRGPCLVRDAWHAQMSRDDEAMGRIRKFRQQSEEMAKLAHDHLHQQMGGGAAQFATSTTATNPQIIPPGYRPDLFIPMLNQERPFASALSQGVIANATPFVVPVFGSFTGASADHVEGVNPTDGTLAFTTKTVTPGAISGLLKLTREIVDSSNPAIDQIALAAMRESYARQTEGKVYTLLNGASGQGGTITAAPPPVTQGFVPSGAQVTTATGTDAGGLAGAALLDAIRVQMALYPFRRFAAPHLALLSQEAVTAFAKAKDSTGRPLLPSVGAMNTNGLGNAITQGWFVDGLPHIPAWAITGNAAGDADTFMLNRADAWVWESPLLTFRYEERSGPAIIDLALFGYFATHLLRPVGLSSVRLTVT